MGVGASGLWGDASERAYDDAERSVTTLLALARCPQCGYHDEVVAQKQARVRTLFGVFMLVLLRYPSDVTGLVTLEAPPPPMPSRPVDPAQLAAFKWI